MLLKDTELNTRLIKGLAKRKINTTEQLCELFPKSYRDYRNIFSVQEAVNKKHTAVKGKLCKIELRESSTKYIVMNLLQEDDETWFRCIMFQNIYKYDYYEGLRGQNVIILGVVTENEYGYSISNPDDIVPELLFKPNIAPVYRKFQGISETTLLAAINTFIENTDEVLEEDILRAGKVINYKDALKKLHNPCDEKDIIEGKKRILFNDMLYFAMALKLGDNGGTINSDIVFKNRIEMDSFKQRLPFPLTEDQQRVINKIYENAYSGKRNNVLLQGDVGCGKTIVAVCLMICAAENGYQSVLMAPRTVLAKQHYDEIAKYAEKCGIKSVFLNSGMTLRERKAKYAAIKSGEVKFIIGTHSCLSEGVEYNNLGLIVTDEEHLFGVKQKEELVKKANQGVHAVSMSATPIPRSLALVLFGENKEICSIRTMPNGRKPVKTATQVTHNNIFPFMLKEIQAGHQCYVVCPAIEESDNEDINLIAIETIEKEYRDYFEPNGVKIGIVNGKMKEDEIANVISEYQRNERQILISTTVIEVGVNVPNSTVMVIEQADRFGLASLHQLRGRVGRSDLQSYCILRSEDTENPRLKVMVETNDGFKIAESDLVQRGSGNLIGQEQAGMNKFVQKMLANREYFNSIRPLAEYCIKNGYGKNLFDIYQ